MNKIILIGGATEDPKINMTGSGTKVANFSFATSESFKDKNNIKQEKTEYHKIVAWKGLAELCEKFVKKGSHLCLEGKISSRSWDDVKTGQKRYITEIMVFNLEFLGKAPQQQEPKNDDNYGNTFDNQF